MTVDCERRKESTTASLMRVNSKGLSCTAQPKRREEEDDGWRRSNAELKVGGGGARVSERKKGGRRFLKLSRL